MICELCGRDSSACKRVRIEGSVVVACNSCASLGEVVGPAVVPVRKPASQKKVAAPQRVDPKPKERDFKVDVEFDLVEDFGKKIKAARERLNLKQEELGMLVNEPASFIHHIEQGRAEPSLEVARKLQGKLGVRLLAPHVEEDVELKSPDSKELTLGDVVVVKKRGEGK